MLEVLNCPTVVYFVGHEDVWHGFIDILFSSHTGISESIATVPESLSPSISPLDSETEGIFCYSDGFFVSVPQESKTHTANATFDHLCGVHKLFGK